jgi:hypothetical protein
MMDRTAMHYSDLFGFFRWLLGWFLTIYCIIITAQSLWGWWVWLAGNDRYMSLLRRYLIIQALRLRFRAFWGDALICLLLCAAFALIWRAQLKMDGIEQTLKSAHVQLHRPS